jgi:hypothetical protein
MTRISSRNQLAGCLVCLAALAWGLAGRSQEAKPKPGDQQPATELKPFYFGVAACKGCHEQKPANETLPLVCECNELTTWKNEDKHVKAYTVLREPRAQRMGQLLGKDVTENQTGCVACHGIVVAKEYTHETFDINDGVSCVVCHGAHREWVVKHQVALDRKEWQQLPRKEKQDRFGLTDLWDPVIRTRMCVSCHIGNPAEGKMVTHEMYAVGHPPLPGFEVATFSDQMPRHWKYLKEKSTDIQKILHFQPGSEVFEKTKLVGVGSAVALAETLRLLGAQADQVKTSKGSGMDFANFDCYACHHDLKSKSWRQERGYVGKPGRPQMRPWPTVVARVSLGELRKTAGGAQGLEDGLKQLYQAFDGQPFGDCDQIGPATKKLAASLTEWANQSAAKPTPEFKALAPELLQSLCRVAQKAIPDYDSAREMAWAFQIIYEDWKPKEAADPEVTAQIKALRESLKLQLPSGKEREIEKELPDSLKRLNDYDPVKFKEHMQKLSQLLQKG